MTPIIEFKNYTFKYRSQSEPTLRDIDLRVNPGGEGFNRGTVRVGKIDSGALLNGWFLFHTLAKAAEL